MLNPLHNSGEMLHNSGCEQISSERSIAINSREELNFYILIF